MKNILLNTAQLLFCSFLLNSNIVIANSISLKQVTADVSFLADDKLSGRASFSPGIDQAADYIANRFKQIGLSPIEGQKDFKQSFNLYRVQLDNIDVMLDKSRVAPENILLLTSYQQLNWNENSQLKTLSINKDDNFRESMSSINQQTDDLIVMVDSSHKKVFNRYRNYFSKGLNRFKINQGPSAVFILSEQKNITNFSVVARSSIEKKRLTNVVGKLPGKKQAEDSILFSAHYDHLGTVNHSDNNEKQQDTIYNGADDDASGTTAVINLAEYFARKNNNQRSLIFVAFTAEEIGGFGSRYFSEKINPDNIIAMLNIEMIGKPSKFGSGEFWMTGYKRSNLASILNKNLKFFNKEVFEDPYPEQQLFYRSDNATLAREGVPAHSLSSSEIDKDTHYHQVSDDIHSLDLNSMTQVIQSIAESVGSLVDGTDTPSRIETKKIKKKTNYF